MNSTSINDSPQIICRQGSTSLHKAIDNHRLRSIQTFRAALSDLDNPAYKAIFKSNTQRFDIVTRWFALVNFQHGGGGRGRPTFRCIYSEREAQDLAPTAPNLWDYCSNPASLGIKLVGEIVFICPPFFSSREPYPDPRPQLCPNVDKNKFVESRDGHGFPPDKSTSITGALLLYYGATVNASYRPQSMIELDNDILRRNTVANAKEFSSNLLFQDCGSILNFNSALSSSRRTGLMMQQWCGTDVRTSLMWTSHLGPTLQLLTQAWLEASPATVTAPTTIPEIPRWSWTIRSLSTSLARCYRGAPPILSAHHRRIQTERFSAFPSSNTKLSKCTNQIKEKRQRALPSLLLKQAPLSSSQPRFLCSRCFPNQPSERTALFLLTPTPKLRCLQSRT